jgi:prepilin-type N-terminal cleavage/methylation domain-containing protein
MNKKGNKTMRVFRNERGFTALEVILVIALVAVIGGAAYYAMQARSNSQTTQTAKASPKASASASPSASKSGQSSGSVLNISQWGVKMTLPAGLTDLSYTLDSKNSMAMIVSKQLKGKPSSCTGQTVTDGSLANVVKSSTSIMGFGKVSTTQIHIGANYYDLGLPNGSSCQKTADLQKLEADQTDMLKQAFRTLMAD